MMYFVQMLVYQPTVIALIQLFLDQHICIEFQSTIIELIQLFLTQNICIVFAIELISLFLEQHIFYRLTSGFVKGV